jgi:hypothetical protein
MPFKIKVKTGSMAPPNGTLDTSELGFDNVNKKLYVGTGTGTNAATLVGPLTLADIGAASNTHVHGNITNSGAIGSTATLPIITTTNGVLTTGTFGTTAGTFTQGNDARLSDARTPLSHTHGNISNGGAIGSTANLPLITTTSGVITTGTFGTTANTFTQGNDSRLSDARTPLQHTIASHSATA